MRKKNLITTIVCIAVAVLMLVVIVVSAIKGREKNPELPPDTTGTETENTTVPEDTDIPIIPIPTDTDEDTGKQGEVFIDVIKENEKHTRPTQPTIEGEPYIGDDVKEVGNAE